MSATEQSIEELVSLLRRDLAAGRTIPSERALALSLGTKRHRVRQALTQLRQDGTIAFRRPGRRRKSAGVADESLIRHTNPLEIIEMRSILEPALARLAAIRATPEDISRISLCATTAPDADYGEADAAFHVAVAAGARNGLAGALHDIVRKVGRDARVRVGDQLPICSGRLAKRDAEHAAIAAAIASRDPDRAERAMREHLAAVHRQIIDRLSPGAGVAPR